MKVTDNRGGISIGIDAAKEKQKTSRASGAQADVSGLDKSSGTKENAGTVAISEEAKLMKQATDLARTPQASSLDKLQALKKSIQQGTYKVDADKVADRIVREHLNVNPEIDF